MEKDKIKSTLFTILFLSWFIGSIIAMMALADSQPYYSIMLFGQYFLVFGLIPLTAKENPGRWIGIPFLLVGLAAIIIPYLMMNPHLLSFEINWEAVIPLLLISVFVIVGISLIVFPILKRKKLEKVCTVPISATIIRHDYTYSDGKKLYCPIYGYEFDKKKYEVSNNVYSNIGLKPEGTTVEIMINPEDPNQFLSDDSNGKILLIMGIIFLLVSLPIFVYGLYAFEFIK